MTPSLKAYKTVCKHLGFKPAKITETIPDIPDATTVIIPNELFDYKQIIKLAQKFGEDQPYEPYVWQELYQQYTAEELSGKKVGDKDYRVVYIPKSYNVLAASVDAQLKQLKGRHVPTVLEAVCFWFTLREASEKLDFNSTYIRHIDLPAKTLGGSRFVAESFVYDDGQPGLDYSHVGIGRDVRVAVGDNLDLAPSLPAALDTSGQLEDQILIDALNRNSTAVERQAAVLERIYRLEDD